MVANVITNDTAQSEQPSDLTLLCPQSNLSEPVRGDALLHYPLSPINSRPADATAVNLKKLTRLKTSLKFCLTALVELQGRFDIHLP